MAFAPERLREIRLLRGNTLQELADGIGVTKQAVSKYEAGKATPATDILSRILKLYDIRQDYLTNERGLPDERSMVFYRTVKRTPRKTKEVAEVYLKWFYEIIAVIDEIYPKQPPDLPQMPEGLSIQDKAKRLRESWKMGEGAIEDMASLLESHGFFLFSVEWEAEKIDGFSQVIGSRPIIIINRKKGTRQRQQFSIAHELGHIILHQNRTEMTEQMEKEADEFAGCFLMPERMIQADLIRDDASYIAEMAEKWYVSPLAMVERCRNLGLLGRNEDENEAKRTSLFQKLNRRNAGEDSDEICSIRRELGQIEADPEAARRFLAELRFPVKELQQLCGLSDQLVLYDQPDRQADINDIEWTQMSFNF